MNGLFCQQIEQQQKWQRIQVECPFELIPKAAPTNCLYIKPDFVAVSMTESREISLNGEPITYVCVCLLALGYLLYCAWPSASTRL